MRKRVQRRPFDTFKYILRKVILLLLAVIVRLFTVTPRWSNYAKALGHGYFGSFIFNSIGTSVLAALIRTCVVVLAAFAFTHLRFRGKNLILGVQDSGHARDAQHMGGNNSNKPLLRGADASSDGLLRVPRHAGI